jgi:hypothetical protein
MRVTASQIGVVARTFALPAMLATARDCGTDNVVEPPACSVAATEPYTPCFSLALYVHRITTRNQTLSAAMLAESKNSLG